ncbi:hypothetical protein [uncultured Paraglaciecola sp.]|uniref:hypothetical protein n=1 Tax=uncultured Paraglaciecola sp. TaxID=1765024 RepID=UPI00259889F6|nr:hypothetical protein [uncultured Paraglaciecola sp.]
MKTLIAFSLLLSLFCHATASEPSSTNDGDVAKIARAVAEVDDRPGWLRVMSNNICISINDGDNIVTTIDEIIKSNIEEQVGLSAPNPDQVASFWNRYVEDMTCEIDGEEVHIMKHSLDQNLAFYSLFKKYLDQKIQRKLVDKSIRIDVNFLTDGQTVLDFVDSQILKYEKRGEAFGDESDGEKLSKMKRTRKLLVRRFNAKLSSELN